MTTPPERYADLTGPAGATDPAINRLIEQLDRALQPRPAPPELRATLNDLLRQSATTAVPSGARLPSTSTPARVPPFPPAQSPVKHRRALSSLAALAAVLVLSLLATALFISHPRSSPVTTQQNFVVPKGAALSLSGISMVSPNEGWAVGAYMPPQAATGTPPSPDKANAVLLHFLNGAWTRVNVPITVIGRPQLNGISMDSPTDGWAVGGIQPITNSGESAQNTAILLHYNGHSWTQVSNSIQANLGVVQMESATSGWALPSMGAADVIYHYDGASWTAQPLPSISSGDQQSFVEIFSLSMTSPDDGWAVGSATPPARTIGNAGYPSAPPTGVILHYTSGKWQIQQLIPNSTIRSISMDSPSDGWAVGNDDMFQYNKNEPDPFDTMHMLLLHYTGGQWITELVHLTHEEQLAGNLFGIAMSSRRDGWMLGLSNVGIITEPGQTLNPFVLLHYDGTSWTEVAMPIIVKDRRQYNIVSFALASPNEVWAVGEAFSTPANGLPMTDSAGSGYTPTVTPVILRYHDGAWTVYSS